MDIAKSSDNTYAITDLSLEDLTMFWHIFNRSETSTLNEYCSRFPTEPDDDISADAALLIMETNDCELIDFDLHVFHVLNDYLTDGMTADNNDVEQAKKGQSPAEQMLSGSAADWLIDHCDDSI